MSADPYVTVEGWVDQLDIDGYADTCADEAYGDQWARMDAHLAEKAPWPPMLFNWDAHPKLAKVLAECGLYGDRYQGQWGVFMMCSRGPQAERLHRRRQEDRLLNAIFGTPATGEPS